MGSIQVLNTRNIPDIGSSDVPSRVESVLGEIKSYADSARSEASMFANELVNAATTGLPDVNINQGIWSINPTTISPTPFVPGTITTVTAPSVGSPPSFTTPVTMEVSVASWGETVPDVTLPAAPNTPMPSDPGSTPQINIPDAPEVPIYSEPIKPNLPEISVPELLPVADIPYFSGTPPTMSDLIVPANLFVYSEAPYRSDLADAIKAKLLSDMAAGGTGLGADVENAIWQRARERQRVEYEVNYNKAMESHPGFDLPPGALMAKLEELNNGYQRALDQTNYEIMIEQSRLALQNKQWTLEHAIAYEGALLQNFNQIAQRSFEVAKATGQAAVDLFGVQVQAHNLRLEAYKTDASVYETLVRASVSQLEKQRLQLEAVKIRGELRQQDINLYLAQWESIKTLVGVYSERVKAMSAIAGLEELKLRAFSESVAIYKAKIDARTAEFNLWQARIAGETAKIDLYGKRVDAYRAQIEGSKVIAEINKIDTEAAVQTMNARVKAYEATVEAAKLTVQAGTANAEAQARVIGAQAEAYKTEVAALEANAQLGIEAVRLAITAGQAETQIQIENKRVELTSALQQTQIQVEAIRASLQAATQVAASALAAMNVSASMGHSGSTTYGYHEQIGNTYSESVSKNEAGA